MPATQLAVGLKTQGYKDPSWHTELDAGLTAANDRLTLSGNVTPEGAVVGYFKGQHYFRTDTKEIYRFNGTLSTNTGWVLQTVAGADVSLTGAYATAQALATAFATSRKYNFYNAFINGSTLVSQRFPSESASGTLGTTVEDFPVDRIFVRATGGTVTWRRTGSNLHSQAMSPLGIEIEGGAGITNVLVGTRLGKHAVRKLGALKANQNIYIGVKIKHSGSTTTITPELVGRSTSQASDTLAAKFASLNKTIRVGPTAFAAGLAPGNEISYVSGAIDLGAMTDGQNGIELAIDFLAMNLATIKFTLTDFWIAQEDISAILECDDFQTELEKCLLFYRKTFNYETQPASNAGFAGSVAMRFDDANDSAIPWQHGMTVRVGELTTYNPRAAGSDARSTDDTTTKSFVSATPGQQNSYATFQGSGAGTPQQTFHMHAKLECEWKN